MDGARPPMKLSVMRRRVKHKKRKIEVIRIHQSYKSKDCDCRVVYRPCQEPVLVIRVEVFHSPSSGSSVMDFYELPPTE